MGGWNFHPQPWVVAEVWGVPLSLGGAAPIRLWAVGFIALLGCSAPPNVTGRSSCPCDPSGPRSCPLYPLSWTSKCDEVFPRVLWAIFASYWICQFWDLGFLAAWSDGQMVGSVAHVTGVRSEAVLWISPSHLRNLILRRTCQNLVELKDNWCLKSFAVGKKKVSEVRIWLCLTTLVNSHMGLVIVWCPCWHGGLPPACPSG